MPVLIRFNALVGTVTAEYTPREGEQLYAMPEGFDLDGWEFAEGTLRKKPARWTRLQFMERFEITELAGIYAAAGSDPVIAVFLDKIKVAEFIEPANVQVGQGLAYLIGKELLTEARKVEILA